MKLGLFIGRLNPPHIGHIKTIEKALEENDKVLVLLGSPIKKDDNNPFSFYVRKSLLNLKLKDSIIIKEIVDEESDLEWLSKIINMLDNNFEGITIVNFYGGDFKNDSAYNVIKEYNKIIEYNIQYIENSRNNSFIEHNGEKYEVSATNLRKALKEKKNELVEKFCDTEMFSEIRKYF